MHFVRFGFLLSLFLLINIPIRGQQIQQPTSPTPALQDPQAVSVLNQSLAVAGGANAIKAVADYTATGKITYNWNPQEQGTVTVLGLGFGQIRMDANLTRGIYSFVIADGQTTTKTEEGSLTQYPPPYPIPSSDARPYQPPMFPGSLAFPHSLLAAVLGSPRFSILYKGTVQVEGISAHDIQAQIVFPRQTRPEKLSPV